MTLLPARWAIVSTTYPWALVLVGAGLAALRGPTTEGAAAIQPIKAECSRARVLVMSGYNDDDTLLRGIAQGAVPFIAKPFTAEALASAVEDALSR